MKKSKITPITLMLLLVVFVSSCGGSDDEENRQAVAEKYDCDNVEDCLTNFNFEAARAHLNNVELWAKRDTYKKIVNAETNYWINAGEFDKALSIMEEGKVGIEDGIYGHEYNRMRFDLISSVVDKLLDKEAYKEAKRWALKCPNLTVEGWGTDSRDYNEKTNMKNTLLTKIKETEELMK